MSPNREMRTRRSRARGAVLATIAAMIFAGARVQAQEMSVKCSAKSERAGFLCQYMSKKLEQQAATRAVRRLAFPAGLATAGQRMMNIVTAAAATLKTNVTEGLHTPFSLLREYGERQAKLKEAAARKAAIEAELLAMNGKLLALFPQPAFGRIKDHEAHADLTIPLSAPGPNYVPDWDKDIIPFLQSNEYEACRVPAPVYTPNDL